MGQFCSRIARPRVKIILDEFKYQETQTDRKTEPVPHPILRFEIDTRTHRWQVLSALSVSLPPFSVPRIHRLAAAATRTENREISALPRTWNFAVLVRQKGRFHCLAGVAGRAGLAETVRGNVAVLPDADGLWHGALTNGAQRRR